MFSLYDRVLDKVTGKPCFIIDVDDRYPEKGIIYGLEAEDQYDDDWFRWAWEHELEKLPEHRIPQEEYDQWKRERDEAYRECPEEW